MPEGDTVFLAATRLRPELAGRTLTRTDFRVPRYATVDLSGRRVEEVVSRGKHLLFRLEGETTIHSHFGMEGEWVLTEPGRPWRAPGHQARIVLENEKVVAVGFRLKIAEVISTTTEEEALGHLGPDVLGPDWDGEEVVRRLEKEPDRPISEALTDQTVMAGPGNVYKCEICFLRGLHPLTPVGAAGDLTGIVKLTKRLMESNRTTGRQVTTGDLRRGRGQWVYGRGGQPCRRCRTPISRAESLELGGRVTYWCSYCQPARHQDP